VVLVNSITETRKNLG